MDLLEGLRNGAVLSRKQQTKLILQLSWPAIMGQLSIIAMQYIDAAMVGRLGSNESAAIGLVASSTWLFSELMMALEAGFNIPVAQSIGGGLGLFHIIGGIKQHCLFFHTAFLLSLFLLSLIVNRKGRGPTGSGLFRSSNIFQSYGKARRFRIFP